MNHRLTHLYIVNHFMQATPTYSIRPIVRLKSHIRNQGELLAVNRQNGIRRPADASR